MVAHIGLNSALGDTGSSGRHAAGCRFLLLIEWLLEAVPLHAPSLPPRMSLTMVTATDASIDAVSAMTLPLRAWQKTKEGNQSAACYLHAFRNERSLQDVVMRAPLLR